MASSINSDNGVISGSSGLKSTADSSGVLALQTNGTTAVTVDTSQNVGMGVTPSAWGGAYKALQLSTKTSLSQNASDMLLSANAYNNGPGWLYLTSSYATTYVQSSTGQHQWYTAPSGTAGNPITFTQAMTLDTSGNLLVGGTTLNTRLGQKVQSTTTSNYGGASLTSWTGAQVYWAPLLDFNKSRGSSEGSYTTVANGDCLGILNFRGADGSAFQDSAAISAYVDGTVGAGAMPGRIIFQTAPAGSTSLSERARIDSSGRYLVNNTANTNGYISVTQGTYYGIQSNTGSNGAGIGHVVFTYNNTNTCGTITTSSGTSTAYNTSSDYRLKHDVVPMTGALAKVTALKPVTYKWNADDSDGEGFIAHELAEVCPHAVTGEKDAVDEDGNIKPQGIDTSFLVATLTAAIQEQQAIITSLTDRITALEAAQ